MTNETTPRGYPLPSPDNIAREDATRIREAIQQIDADVTNVANSRVDATEEVVGSVRLATADEATAGTSTTIVPAVKRVADMLLAAINAEVTARNSAVTAQINALKGNAPAAYDTLVEIATKLTGDDTAIAGMLTSIANRVQFDAAQSLTGGQKTQALSNIGAQPAGSYQPAGNYQAALGFTPVNKAGDTINGALNVTGQLMGGDVYNNRGNGTGYYFFAGNGGIYLGWDGSGNIVSTHWLISPNGNRYATYNEVVTNIRGVNAGTFTPGYNSFNQIGNAFVTGMLADDNGWQFQARYIQYAVNGQWFTAGWAS